MTPLRHCAASTSKAAAVVACAKHSTRRTLHRALPTHAVAELPPIASASNIRPATTQPRATSATAVHQIPSLVETIKRSPPPAPQEKPKITIVAAPLSPDIDNDKLKLLFTRYGKVEQASVCRDIQTKQSLGYGFVRFTAQRAARKALQLDGKEVDGYTMHVRALEERLNEVYIRDLPEGMNKFQLRALFERYGRVNDARTRKIRRGKTLLHSGFVTFGSAKEAARAVELSGMEVEGKRLSISLAKPDLEGEQGLIGDVIPVSRTIVARLPPVFNEERMRDFFSGCGEIAHARIHEAAKTDNAPGTNDSFVSGYVVFVSPSSVDKALKLDGMHMDSHPISIHRAEPHQAVLALHRPSKPSDLNTSRVLVRGFPKDVGPATLRLAFRQYGDVRKVVVFRHRMSGQSLGFGSVQFDSVGAAAEAIRNTGMSIHGSPVTIRALGEGKTDDTQTRVGP
ncbi:unnamed protein product [Peniophora sp. CBMAI 1063]|nr:unnamed protein product [Peniophora sp. CBMAI 1063]